MVKQHSQHQEPQAEQPAFQQTWQRADLDAIPAPDYCNLPVFEIEHLKQQWEGKPVQLPTGLKSSVQSCLNSFEVAAWKKYLLQVGHLHLSDQNILLSRLLIHVLLQGAYDLLSIELGYQVLSSTDDDDDNANV